MSFYSRDNSHIMNQIPNSYKRASQTHEDQLYYNKMEKHLCFMEKEFKMGVLWQRELINHIKQTRNEQPIERMRKGKTLHLNSKEELFLKKLLKKHCQIKNDHLELPQLIKLAAINYNSPLKKSQTQRYKESKNGVYWGGEDNISHKSRNNPFSTPRQYQQQRRNEYQDARQTSHFKEIHQSQKSQFENASLIYSSSYQDPQRQRNDNDYEELLISKQSEPKFKPLYWISKVGENTNRPHVQNTPLKNIIQKIKSKKGQY